MNTLLLLAAFLFTGLVTTANKALVAWGLGEYSRLYLLSFYLTATLLALIVTRNKGNADDRKVGLTMGASGALGLIFLILTLRHMPGIVVFPTKSVGEMILTAAVGVLAWKERLSVYQWAGIAASLIAVYLLS